ncbi:hypothetical protein N499_0962A, partial [Wolbachia pipientis wVitA]
MTNSA